ncbi:6-phospho-beta-glucosidase [Myxococcota bacterium]
MKVAVIGGGSTYTPELIEGLIAHRDDLGLAEVALMDIEPERLAVVGDFCRRMVEHSGAGFRVAVTTDRGAALDQASFVLTQIRVGGQPGRHKDIQLGLRHGLVGQETTGVGGFAKALRTVPVILDICKEMEARCPQAWLINFTNPSGLVTEAILKHGRERAIGLCNNPINLKIDVAKYLGVKPEQVQLDYIGLNHLSWVRRILVDGKDVLPQALEAVTGAGRPANIPEELDYPPGFLKSLGMIPSSYLRYYYLTRQAVAELQAKTKSRAEEVMEVEEELMAVYRDSNAHEKPAALSKRGGANYSRAAFELIRAIHLDLSEIHVVNTRNQSTITCLPPDCAVEVACRVDAAGADPLPLDPPGPQIRGLIQHVKAYEELAVQAAVSRSRRVAILALSTHPLVADVELSETLVQEIENDHGIQFSED